MPTKLQEIEIQVLNTSTCRDLMPLLNQQSVQDEMVCIWDPRDVPDDEKRGMCQVRIVPVSPIFVEFTKSQVV